MRDPCVTWGIAQLACSSVRRALNFDARAVLDLALPTQLIRVNAPMDHAFESSLFTT